jgi:glutathione S-transferase
MPDRIQHYGWLVSPYSAKTRAYLKFKGVEFDDVAPTARKLMWTIRRAVGRPVMPTILTPEGEWMQDTSEIIDTLETRLGGPSITPTGPRQRLASALLELHGDEWLPTVAMHTRWNIPENTAFAKEEFGRCGFPYLPTVLSKRLTGPIADRMAGYLPILGVQAETIPGIERFLQQTVATLEAHLQVHPFLFGTRPSLGDFALYGPLWAHAYRDPGSKKFFEGAPAVIAWFDRLATPTGESGAFLADDEMPTTLDPLFETLFAEQMVFVVALIDAIDAWCADNPDATRVPRSLGPHELTIGGCTGTRKFVTFTQWMAQRPYDVYAGLEAEDLTSVNAWLERVGGLQAMSRRIENRLVRRDFKMGLA